MDIKTRMVYSTTGQRSLAMSTQAGPQYSKKRRKNTLRMFYVFVFLATGTFTVAVKANGPWILTRPKEMTGPSW